MGVEVGVIMAFSLHRLVSMSAVHLFIIHLAIAYLLAFCSCVYSFLALLVEINERGLSHIATNWLYLCLYSISDTLVRAGGVSSV